MSKQEEHIIRINKVKKFIEENVDQKLSLSTLAEKACYSPFHFQRLFKSVVGETPKQYIKRLRLESTAHHIVLKPETSILEVALRYGFNSLEAFSRAFKNYYGFSPDEFRKIDAEDKMYIIHTKIKSDRPEMLDSSSFLVSSIKNELDSLKIKVVKLPAKKLIYVPVTLKDADTVIRGYKKIKQWANARDLVSSNSEIFGLMLDFPAFTALEKCRFYTCVAVESKPEVSKEIGYMELPSKTYATFKVKGEINELMKSVSMFATQWLPESGYEIYHVPAILIPLDDPTLYPLNKTSCQIYIGLKPK